MTEDKTSKASIADERIEYCATTLRNEAEHICKTPGLNQLAAIGHWHIVALKHGADLLESFKSDASSTEKALLAAMEKIEAIYHDQSDEKEYRMWKLASRAVTEVGRIVGAT